MGFWSRFSSAFEQGTQLGAAGARQGMESARERREYDRRRKLLQMEQFGAAQRELAGLESGAQFATGQVDLGTSAGAQAAVETLAPMGQEIASRRTQLSMMPGAQPSLQVGQQTGQAGGASAVSGTAPGGVVLPQVQQRLGQARTVQEAYARLNPTSPDNEEALENLRAVLSTIEPPDKVETMISRTSRMLDRMREDFFRQEYGNKESLSADALAAALLEYRISPVLARVYQLQIASKREREKQDKAQLGLAQEAGARAETNLVLQQAQMAMNMAEMYSGTDPEQAGMQYDRAVSITRTVSPDLADGMAPAKNAFIKKSSSAPMEDLYKSMFSMMFSYEGRENVRAGAQSFNMVIPGKADDPIPAESLVELIRRMSEVRLGVKPVRTVAEQAEEFAAQVRLDLLNIPEGLERDSKIDEVEAMLSGEETTDGPLVLAKLASMGALQRGLTLEKYEAAKEVAQTTVGGALGGIPGLGQVAGAVAGAMIPKPPKASLSGVLGPGGMGKEEIAAAVEEIVAGLRGRSMTEEGMKSLRPQIEKMLRDYSLSYGDFKQAVTQVKRQFRLATP